MSSFTIPTIYTAIDKFSPAVKAMERANASFGSRLDSVSAKSERLFRKLTPGLSDATKQMLSFASSAAIVSGALATGAFSVKSIMDYETAIQSLEAVTGVSSSAFTKDITELANSSKKSSIDVVKSFEVIGSAMSQYLSDPKGLHQIAEAGITLSKASKMELEPTLQALTSVMNQFDLKAEQASDTINRLTAGEIVGSVTTSKIAEYLQEFGASAKLSNVSVAESVALIEALGVQMKSDKIAVGARNLLTVLDSAKGLDKNAQASLKKSGVSLSFLMDKSQSLSARLHELSKIQNDAVAITNVFGKENKTAAQVIFNQLGRYDEFADKIQKTNQAEVQAATNSNTLSNKLVELKNKWINMLTSSDAASTGLNKAKHVVGLLADNLDTIVSVGFNVLKFFALWKIANIALKASLIATRAISTAFFIHDMVKYVASTQGITYATAAWSVAQESLNAAMLANPIGLFILGIAALAAAIYGIHKAIEIFDEPLNAAFQRQEQLRQETFRVQDLRDQYLALGKTLKEAERMAISASKVQTVTQLVSAKEMVNSLDPEIRQQGVDKINELAAVSRMYQTPTDIFTKDIGQRYANSMDTKSFVGSVGSAQEVQPIDWLSNNLNPNAQGEGQNANNEIKGKIEVDFKNVPQGAEVKSESKFVSIKTSSTMLSAAR
jgi:TP901 family phage tail tape measure protein